MPYIEYILRGIFLVSQVYVTSSMTSRQTVRSNDLIVKMGRIFTTIENRVGYDTGLCWYYKVVYTRKH